MRPRPLVRRTCTTGRRSAVTAGPAARPAAPPVVAVVPGLAATSYVHPAVAALRARGWDARLLLAPGSPGVPADLVDYGRWLADHFTGEPDLDLLVGLSVGAQAAAAACASGLVPRRLVLVSPTVDPRVRRARALFTAWLAGGRREPARLIMEQAPDWAAAGPRRVVQVVRSALRLPLEQALREVTVPVVIVHAERDALTSHAWAAQLAAEFGARLVLVPGATHSWPYGDTARFADVVQELLS